MTIPNNHASKTKPVETVTLLDHVAGSILESSKAMCLPFMLDK